MRRCAILVCVLLIMVSTGAQGANLNVSIASLRERFAKADCAFDYSPLADGSPRWLGKLGTRTTVELMGKTQLSRATIMSIISPADVRAELMGPVMEAALAVAVCMPRSDPEDVAFAVGRLFMDAVERGGKAQTKQDGIVILGEVTTWSLMMGFFLIAAWAVGGFFHVRWVADAAAATIRWRDMGLSSISDVAIWHYVVGLLFLGFWIYAIVDAASAPERA